MVPRRTLLRSVPGLAALAILASCGRNSIIDVRDFGARGDGVTDDSDAIVAAGKALRSNSTLLFPTGTYRFAKQHPPGGAAIVIGEVSDVSVEFEPGAELRMDNLDPSAGTGTSHGLVVRGPASRISLRNVTIRWSAGAKRSLGDGIRIEGYPLFEEQEPNNWSGPGTPVAGVSLSDCVVRGSPQTGVVMIGASNIFVTRLRVAETGADGLHFNACREAKISDYSAVATGDDGLALVTYFGRGFEYDSAEGTFAFSSLTEWSNTDFEINNISVVGGRTNGVRIAGAQRVTIGSLGVVGARSGAAVMIDSAQPGADARWHYPASRSVKVLDLSATDCEIGVHVLARPGESADRLFTDFDVHINEARLGDCSNWSVRAESLSEPQMRGLRIDSCITSSSSTNGGSGGLGLSNTRGISLGKAVIRSQNPVVVFNAENAVELDVNRVNIAIGAPSPPPGPVEPCVSIAHSNGIINDLEIEWPAAPSAWNAVRLAGGGQCGLASAGPVAIREITLPALVSGSSVECR